MEDDAVARDDKKLNKVSRYGWAAEDAPGELCYIDTDLLNVDERYQRPENHNHALRIARDWSFMSCGAVIVAERLDGTLWVVDGQHRVLAAKNRPVEKLPCIVFKSASLKEEAQAFLSANIGRRFVKSIDKHRTAVVAEDATALLIQRLTSELGLEIVASAKAPGQLAFVALCARRVTENRADFETVLRFMAALCQYENAPLHEQIFDGLWYLHRNIKGGLQNERLARRIRETGLDRLKDGLTRANAFYRKGGAKVWATGMLQEINKNLRTKFEFEQAA